jgi:arylsulfatase
LIVHWPAGVAARGELRHDPCHFIDLIPTILDVTGSGDYSPKWNGETAVPLPGTSLAPAFTKNNAVKHDFIYFHHMNNRAIRIGNWKLVARDADGPWELYNLKIDRCETKNLAGQYPDKVHEMSAKWQKHEDEFIRQAGPPPTKPKRR